jgi:hypothetical protein
VPATPSRMRRRSAFPLNNYFNNGDTLTPRFASLFGLAGPKLANALTELDGEVATGEEQGAFALTNQFLNLMLDPFVERRTDGQTGGDARRQPRLRVQSFSTRRPR